MGPTGRLLYQPRPLSSSLGWSSRVQRTQLDQGELTTQSPVSGLRHCTAWAMLGRNDALQVSQQMPLAFSFRAGHVRSVPCRCDRKEPGGFWFLQYCFHWVGTAI